MALRSMTACGRATLTNTLGRFIVELQSQNRKHFDLSIQLPPELQCYESEIRKWIYLVVSRGQLTLKLIAECEAAAPVSVKPNLPFVRQLKNAWDAIANELGLEMSGSAALEVLSKYEGILIYENKALDDPALRGILQNVVNMALDKLVGMKNMEGQVLYQDILMRLHLLEELIVKIVDLAPHAVERYKAKIKARLDEFIAEVSALHERNPSAADLIADRVDISREVGVFADRVDIAEEVARFNSHIEQFKSLLEGPDYDIGKTLDFIIQEMKREINTIGSKSNEKQIGHLVIEVKTELERIREQIQNVE